MSDDKDIYIKIQELPVAPLLSVYSTTVDDLSQTKAKILEFYERLSEDPNFEENSKVNKSWNSVIYDIKQFLKLWADSENIFRKSQSIKFLDRVLPPVDKNGIVSSTTKTTLQQTKKDDSSSNTSEPTTVKRGTQKEKGVSTKTDQKVAPPSIDMQMSDIDTTDTDDDNETNGQKSNHLKNQENTKNIKKGGGKNNKRKFSKSNDENNDNNEEPPKKKRKTNNEEEQILYKQIISMLVELQQGLSEKDEKDDINQITDWTVENNPSITMARSAVIRGPKMAEFCSFCKSLKWQNQCTTENCPGHSKYKIRKYTMTPANMSRLKLFASGQAESFIVNCGSQLAYNNLEKEDKDEQTSKSSQQKKAKCGCQQILKKSSSTHPFLIMESNHKKGCQFRTTDSDSESEEQKQDGNDGDY